MFPNPNPQKTQARKKTAEESQPTKVREKMKDTENTGLRANTDLASTSLRIAVGTIL